MSTLYVPGMKARAYRSSPNWLDSWMAKTASTCAWIAASPIDGSKTRTLWPRPSGLCPCDEADAVAAEMPPASGTVAATAAPRSTVRRGGGGGTALPGGGGGGGRGGGVSPRGGARAEGRDDRDHTT